MMVPNELTKNFIRKMTNDRWIYYTKSLVEFLYMTYFFFFYQQGYMFGDLYAIQKT